MGRWAQRRRCGTDTTAALIARVTSVVKTASNQLTWTFNVIVVSNGSPVAALNDDALSSAGAPIASNQSGPRGVLCSYSGTVNVGDHWSIGTTPLNLANPNGSGFLVPQGGNAT